MRPFDHIVAELGYRDSPYWRIGSSKRDLGAHIFRSAAEAGVRGEYVYEVSPADSTTVLPAQTAVYVASAPDEVAARYLHRRVWNLGSSPFLLVVLEGQVRIYSGFLFSASNEDLGVLGEVDLDDLGPLVRRFSAPVIDSGEIWGNERRALRSDDRVDSRLLENLSELSLVLRSEFDLARETAHALIGKYIYVSYLDSREILSEAWLNSVSIEGEDVFGRDASMAALRRLVQALEDRFNGNIFPFPLSGDEAPSDRAVSFTAGVFRGDRVVGEQLALDFAAYDFSVIPIELLSSIYEQFLHSEGKGRKQGAFYTPEPIAEYVLAEVNSARPLEEGMRVLDPACGSGVFLVLAYRRLIESAAARRPDGRLKPTELRAILQDHIFGVERNVEACYVTEFSLLLTLLSYLEPPELHRNQRFKFPSLHQQNIFHADFFDVDSTFSKQGLKFDWVVGNPPWKRLKAKERADEPHVVKWVNGNRKKMPVGQYQVAEAFLWAVREHLTENGVAGLLVLATSLVNATSSKFRAAFFAQNRVFRITNFSSLAYRIFRGRAKSPAASIIYEPAVASEAPVVHVGPLVANQAVMSKLPGAGAWALTIHEDEIQPIEAAAARSGDGRVWRMAFWGSQLDRQTLQRLSIALPHTIASLSEQRGWHFAQGVPLRTGDSKDAAGIEEVAELKGQYYLDHAAVEGGPVRLRVPEEHLRPVGGHTFVRQGRTIGIGLIRAPHIWITTDFAAFSSRDFVFKHPAVGISGPPQDTDELKAISVFLSSSLGRYLAFFSSTSWGFDRSRLNYGDVASIPVPELQQFQINRLAALHDQLHNEGKGLTAEESARLDNGLGQALDLPDRIMAVAQDFVTFRLELIQGKSGDTAAQRPSSHDLEEYGRTLRDSLDSFSADSHLVEITPRHSAIECRVTREEGRGSEPLEVVISQAREDAAVWDVLREQRSQWIYVQRSLRVFTGSQLVLLKPARRVNWSRSEAFADAQDAIAEILLAPEFRAEATRA